MNHVCPWIIHRQQNPNEEQAGGDQKQVNADSEKDPCPVAQDKQEDHRQGKANYTSE